MLGAVHLSWLQSHETTAEVPELVRCFLLPLPEDHLETGQMMHFQQNKEIPLSSSHLQHNHKTPGKTPNHSHTNSAHSIARMVSVSSEIAGAGTGDRGCCVLGAAASTEDEVMVVQHLVKT